jgi:DNA-binding protein YbaB
MLQALVTVAIDDATRRVEQQSDAANELKKLGASIKDDEKVRE